MASQDKIAHSAELQAEATGALVKATLSLTELMERLVVASERQADTLERLSAHLMRGPL